MLRVSRTLELTVQVSLSINFFSRQIEAGALVKLLSEKIPTHQPAPPISTPREATGGTASQAIKLKGDTWDYSDVIFEHQIFLFNDCLLN